MWFLSNSCARCICFIVLVSVVHSYIMKNELLRLKLHLAGHALGAIGASGFGAGLLAGAAYQHHKKHYHRHELLHKKDNAERKEEKKSETKYHLHSYDVGLPPYAFVSLLRDDPHHVLGSSLKHGVVITHRGSQW